MLEDPFSFLTPSPPFKRLFSASRRATFSSSDSASSPESSERTSAPSLSIAKFEALRFLLDLAFEEEVEGGGL